jgi:RNA polymerase sigma-70 factor (sigma-E family)
MLEPVTATTDGPGPDEAPPPLLPTFEQVFADQRVPLIRLAYLLTSSDEIAEDLVQDAFARLHERWERVDEPAAYLRTCVVNASRSLFRRRDVARRRAHLTTTASSTTDAPDELADALASLPARRRAAIVLRFYEQRPVADVARILGISEGAVKSSVSRGLDQLRKDLS